MARTPVPDPAGTRYSAFDPELMLWTMAVIADSAPYFYELFVRELSERERELLWQEYVRFAGLFGMPARPPRRATASSAAGGARRSPPSACT